MHNTSSYVFTEPTPHKSTETDAALQRYMQLSQQQDQLRHRQSLSTPTSSPIPLPSNTTSLSSSPVRTTVGYSYQELHHIHSSPISIHPMPTSTTQASADDAKLYEINHQIKATLTELLNTESVKHDDKFRQWVQGRLMDAEQQLRKHRRRRSSVDMDMVNTIAHSIEDMHHVAYRPTY